MRGARGAARPGFEETMSTYAKRLGALIVGAALSAPLLAQQGSQKTYQCWDDDKGQRICGDRVPPSAAGKTREVIRDGRVLETKKVKTAEEIAEEKRKKREAEEQQRRADYDRALLETYRSAKDIEAMRDERLLMLDGRITSTEKNAAGTDRSLADLRARAEAQQKNNKPVDARLAKQIQDFERAQQENQRSLERSRAERAEIESKFNRDLVRYQQLRGEAPATPVAPPPDAAPAAVAPTPPPADGARPSVPAEPAAAPKAGG